MSEPDRPTEHFAEPPVPEPSDHDLVVVTEYLPGQEPTEYGVDLRDGPPYEYRTRFFRCRQCGQERNRREEFTEPCTATRSDPVTDGGYSIEDARTRRALTESMAIQYGERGPVYAVRAASGQTYTVDVATGTCSCPDFVKRAPEKGCKHLRRVRLEIRAGNVPDPTGRFTR